MAVTFQLQIKKKSITGGGILQTAPRSVSSGQVVGYDALAIPDGTMEPDDITEQHVVENFSEQTSIYVSQSLFWWYEGQEFNSSATMCPWLICSAIRVERDQGERLLFRIAVEYRTPTMFSVLQDDLYPMGLMTDLSQFPYVKETVWTGEERVIYKEAETSGNNYPLRVPGTNSYYSESFRRRYPTRTIRQAQFENISTNLIDQTIEDRLFTVNGTEFGGTPGGTPDDPAEPPRWMITGIDYQYITCANSANDLLNGYLMTYTIERNSSEGGWYDRRALTDYYHMVDGEKTAYRDDGDMGTVTTVLLDDQGVKLANQLGEPEFRNYTVQPALDWSFLK